MGSLFKSKTQTVQTQNPYERNPWKPQEDYLIGGFESAKDALTGALGSLGGITDFTADMTAGQDQAAQDQIAYNQGLMGQGTNMINLGNNLSGNLSTAAGNANAVFGQAGVDPTQQIVGNAGQYINNDVLQGQIDAAIGDVNRGFQKQQGQINSGASAGGNINSTRAGVMEAMALDDAQDRAAQISSTMRGDAYSQGLGLAAQTHQQGIGNQLAANQQIAGLGSAGMGAILQGANLGAGAAGQVYDTNALYQTQAQNEILGKINGAQLPLNLVGQYMQTVGGNYGGHGYETTSQTFQKPSLFGQITGAAAGLMGGFGAMRGA